MNRKERKKMLVVQGMLHRLELAEAVHDLKAGARPAAVIAMLPRVLSLIVGSKAMPLLGSALALVAGKSKWSRVARRVLVVAGLTTAILSVIRRQKP